MYTACREGEGLSGWMHVYSLQSMRRLEWVDIYVHGKHRICVAFGEQHFIHSHLQEHTIRSVIIIFANQ